MTGTFVSDARTPVATPVPGESNLVVQATGKCLYVKDLVGPWSINTATRGTITWRHEGRSLRVDQRSFLVLPEGGAFTLEIAERQAVELCCVYFRKGFVESVHSAMLAKDLDPQPPLRLDLLAHVHPGDARIALRMRQLANGPLIEDDALRTGEHFTSLARELILLDRATQKAITFLPALKASTREELFRRISRGKDFIHSQAFVNVGLDEIAGEACLSPFHFHRAFTKVFGMAPHKYVTRLRIEKAAELFASDRELTVMAVAQQVGFRSVTSFSRLFRSHLGISPLHFKRR